MGVGGRERGRNERHGFDMVIIIPRSVLHSAELSQKLVGENSACEMSSAKDRKHFGTREQLRKFSLILPSCTICLENAESFNSNTG